MTNLEQLRTNFPVGTQVEVIINCIQMFKGIVQDYTIDDCNPKAIVVNTLTNEVRYYSNNQLVDFTV